VDAAREAIARALALTPDNAEALLERGILRQLRGDEAGARADWQRAMELAPESVAADLRPAEPVPERAGPQRR
jgi:regulator of sirC expression with transglutaminase-like and TPR domain